MGDIVCLESWLREGPNVADEERFWEERVEVEGKKIGIFLDQDVLTVSTCVRFF